MYHSNSNCNTNTTLDQTLPYSYWPSLSYQNPLPSSFFLSPPCIHFEDDQNFLHDLFHHHQQHQPPVADVSGPVSNTSEINSNDKFMSPSEQFPRKRSCKKDRHSKIETAQGPRDRRMRLSLEVARKFFNLQDMLGFDKASKTVGWLLAESKTAIEELKRGFPHMKLICSVGGNNYSSCSTSECEIVSGINESAVNGYWYVRKGKGSKSLGKEKKNIVAISRKHVFDPIARESRNKARARARERTKERKRFDEHSRLGSWNTFENGDESGTQNLDLFADVEEMNSSTIFKIYHENHFADFQVYGNPWEAYNNIDLC